MRESIAVDTVCEFVQVYTSSLTTVFGITHCHLLYHPLSIQAALTYQQTTLQEECLCFIEDNTEVHRIKTH